MNYLEQEIYQLKISTLELWDLVLSQLNKSKEALQHYDKNLAREIKATEKRVNALELKLDRDCENIIALYNPVAVDLRFVIAVLKINMNLERSGDMAEGIAKYILKSESQFASTLMEQARIIYMLDEAIVMLEMVRMAFEQEDAKLARQVFEKDEILNSINKSIEQVIGAYIIEYQQDIPNALHILSSIRKIERVGDQSKNIAEEVIFYLEAKVLKHMKKRELRTENQQDIEGQSKGND
ncbi:MAG TPA: phosphate signaling complex protein PhoU [Chitinophagales bacterium]|nr:phosphate signaling complex protein PhoU [Chitinophagales bacterium]